MRFNKPFTILIVAGLIAGALGGILFDRVFIPKLSFLPGLGWLKNYASNAPIVITRNEQVVLNEGVNLIELSNQASNMTVSIYRGTKPQLTFAGLGTIMTSDGLIFTSKTVVGSQPEMTVITNDGSSYTGTVRALDPKTDLAVLTIPAKNLAVAEFGSSFDLKPGQRVVSVGIANKEYERHLSSGVVTSSVLNNKFLDVVYDSEKLSDSFATSLVLNGNFNSAPVVNLAGKLVAMVADAQGSMIIAENLKPALDSYLQSGEVHRPKLGVQYWNLSSFQAQLKNLPRAGVLILGVDSSGPAYKVLQSNDLVYELDGQELRNKSLEQVLSEHREGQFKAKLIRGGKEAEVIINLVPTK